MVYEHIIFIVLKGRDYGVRSVASSGEWRDPRGTR
jgi:hypothetical protein